mgnify:CR=1 FL=1
MPSAAEFQALSDELRQLGAVIVQAANLAIRSLHCGPWGRCHPQPPGLHGGRERPQTAKLWDANKVPS